MLIRSYVKLWLIHLARIFLAISLMCYDKRNCILAPPQFFFFFGGGACLPIPTINETRKTLFACMKPRS